MSKDTFICPRSEAEFRPYLAEWRKERDGIRTCSWDGSLHPDDFMTYVREGLEVGSTDKGYKFYAHEYDAKVLGIGKFYTHHLSPEQSNEFYMLWTTGKINFGMYQPYVKIYLPGLELPDG